MGPNKPIILLIITTFSSILLVSSSAPPPGTHPPDKKWSSSSSSDPNWSALADLDSLCRLTPNPDICEKIGIQGGNPEEALVLADFSSDNIHKILGTAQPEVLDICNKTAHQSTCVLWYYVAVDATCASSANKTRPDPHAAVSITQVLEMEVRATKDLARGLGAELTHKTGDGGGAMYGELFKKVAAEMEAAEEGLRGKEMEKVRDGIRRALAYNKECKEEVAHGVGQVHAEAQFSVMGQSEANSLGVFSESLVKMIRYTTKLDVLAGICMALAVNIDH